MVHLLSLNSEETATQLMVEDFTLFRQIEQTEYIDYIFDLKSKFGSENLTRFSNLVNRETLWVVSEVNILNIVENINIFFSFFYALMRETIGNLECITFTQYTTGTGIRQFFKFHFDI